MATAVRMSATCFPDTSGVEWNQKQRDRDERQEARGKRQETVEWPSHLALQDEPARAGLVAEKPRSAEIGPGSAPGGRQFHLHHAVMRGLEGASCD